MCFSGPVRVLSLQSTEQVQVLWLLLLQLRHWFLEDSRAEELLQLSVGRKSERKTWDDFTLCMHHKKQSQGNCAAHSRTNTAANPTPKPHMLCITATVWFDQPGYSVKGSNTPRVFLLILWILWLESHCKGFSELLAGIFCFMESPWRWIADKGVQVCIHPSIYLQ